MIVFDEQNPVPILYLSSETLDWDGLLVCAYHEPPEIDCWITPSTPETTLVLVNGGAMLMEGRGLRGQWNSVHISHEDLFLIPGGNPPSESRWKFVSSDPMQTLHMHLNKEILCRTAEEIADYDSAHLTLVGRTGFQDALITQIGFSLWRELEYQSPAGKLYAQTAAQMLAVHLLRHYASQTIVINEPQQGLTRQQVSRVTDFIRVHLTQNLSLEDLAQQVGFSAYHFARLFRQTVGESPHQYVLRQRLERAQRLLRKTDMPLAQVALESGFANQSHLTQVFKRHLALTPKAYRQNYSIRAHF